VIMHLLAGRGIPIKVARRWLDCCPRRSASSPIRLAPLIVSRCELCHAMAALPCRYCQVRSEQ